MGIAVLFGVWFPEEKKEQGRTEGRGSTCSSLYFTPTSSLTSCTCIPLLVLPNAPSLSSSPLLLFFTCIHQHNLTNLAQELRPVWRKCLHPLKSPRASSVILSDIFWPGLSWGPGAAEVFHFHQTSPPTASFSYTK